MIQKYFCSYKTRYILYSLINGLKKECKNLHTELNKKLPRSIVPFPQSREFSDIVAYVFEDLELRKNPNQDRKSMVESIRTNRKQLRTMQSLADFLKCNPKEGFMIFAFRDKKYILSEKEYDGVISDMRTTDYGGLKAFYYYTKVCLSYKTWDFLEHRIIDDIDYLMEIVNSNEV